VSSLTSVALGSAVSWVAVFGVPYVDGFFPFVPGESVVIAVGVVAAATHDPRSLGLFGLACLGAWLGDQTSYLLGRRLSRGAGKDRQRRPRFARVQAWVDRELARGDLTLFVAARFVPYGRTVVTVTAGARRYPRRRFLLLDAVAAVLWTTYAASLGYAGGAAFEHHPVLGLVLGLATAAVVTAAIEIARRVRDRSAA
jgi:membrane-associated protein